jgi:hypothetical protein
MYVGFSVSLGLVVAGRIGGMVNGTYEVGVGIAEVEIADPCAGWRGRINGVEFVLGERDVHGFKGRAEMLDGTRADDGASDAGALLEPGVCECGEVNTLGLGNGNELLNAVESLVGKTLVVVGIGA